MDQNFYQQPYDYTAPDDGGNGKKKGKKGKVIAIVLVVFALLGAGVFFTFPYLANAARAMFSSPEKYYRYVEKQNTEERISLISSLYGKRIKDIYQALDEKSLQAKLHLKLGDEAKIALEQLAEIDAEELSELSLFSELMFSEDFLKDRFSLQAEKEGEKLIGADILFDLENWSVFFDVSEVSEKPLLIQVPDNSIDDANEGMEVFRSVINNLPDEKKVNKIITKYTDLILSYAKDVEKEKEELEVGKIKKKYTKLTVSFDEDSLMDLAEAVLEKVLKDSDIEDVFSALLSDQDVVDADEIYEDFLEEVEEVLEDLEDYVDFGDGLEISVWVDAKGNIIGREIDVEDGGKVSFVMLRDGEKFANEIRLSADGLKAALEGSGKIYKNETLSGEFMLKGYSAKVAKIKVKELDLKSLKQGYLNIEAAVEPVGLVSDIIEDLSEEFEEEYGIVIKNPELMVSCKAKEKEGVLKLSLENNGETFVEIEVDCEKKKAAGEIQYPSQENSIELNEWEDLMAWLNQIDYDKLEEIMESLVPQEVLEIIEEFFDDVEDEYWEYEDWEEKEVVQVPKPIEPTPSPTPTPRPTATPTPGPTPIPDRDLGGMDIVIGDHYTPEESYITNMQEEDTWKYRNEIMRKYNFTIKQKTVAGWSEMQEACMFSIMNGDPIAQIFELDYRFVAEPLANGLFYDLTSLQELDFSEEKWNTKVLQLMTVGNGIYGMSAKKSEPKGGVIFNKRLLEDAGFDSEFLYDLQASGDWTWSVFENLCDKLTRDVNYDGVTDIYATVSQGASTIQCLVASTGSDLIGRDEYGRFYNNMQSPEVMAALNFATKLYNMGYEMPQPEGSDWDYFISAFREGKAVMQFNEEYNCQPWNNYGDQMVDDVGFVMPPKPDGAQDYRSYVSDNIAIIPACYDYEYASNIAFAYNLYTMNTPGYNDPRDWMEQYYSHFSDERAVDETIVRFNDGVSTSFQNWPMIAGMSDLVWDDLFGQYPFMYATPAEYVEGFKDSWDKIIAQANQY